MKPITTIAAVLLGLIALVHLLRLVFGWGLVINETLIPMWLSVVVFLVFAVVAVMLWRERGGEAARTAEDVAAVRDASGRSAETEG